MNTLGLVHTAVGVLAVSLGAAILLRRKGTRQHRWLGYGYVAAMLTLNLTALMIYRVFGGFGPFHVLALISLGTLAAGFYPAYRKRPAERWLQRHYELIGWSYIGLLAATAAEIAVRVPALRGLGLSFGLATALASFGVVGIGAWLLYRNRDRSLTRLREDGWK